MSGLINFKKYTSNLDKIYAYLAVQNSSIGDLVTHSLTDSLTD